jgi:hypothetical protein
MTDVTRKVLAAAACLKAMFFVGPVPLASAEEPFGIALEGFPYPYPIHMFVISVGHLIHLEAPQKFNEAVL